jgi:hypothetical protein
MEQWNSDAERLGGLEVDREVVLCRCLHGQIGRLLAFEDAIHVAAVSPASCPAMSKLQSGAAEC